MFLVLHVDDKKVLINPQHVRCVLPSENDEESIIVFASDEKMWVKERLAQVNGQLNSLGDEYGR